MQVLTSDTAITKAINVGTVGKASTVKVFGCTFTDLTTVKDIAGAVTVEIVIPAPKSVSDSTLAEVHVNGVRVESFQVITSGVRQFDPRYLVRPFMKEDADLAYGPVLASPASPMVFIDLSTLPKLTAMPATCKFIYYDYVTDTMYYFGNITSLSTITASTSVWTESFASDPVVDYISMASAAGAVTYHFIFTTSGKIIELFAPVTSNFSQTRSLPHGIKSAVPYYLEIGPATKYNTYARVLVLDDKGNLHKYKLLDLTLVGSVLNTNIVKLTGTTGFYNGSGTGTLCALSSEPRANVYAIAANISVAPTLTRQTLNAVTQNMQFIDTFSIGGYSVTGGRWLAYDFSANKLVYVDWSGVTIFGYDFTTDNNLNTLGGRLVYGYSQTASIDGVVRSLYQAILYTSTKNYVGDKAWNWMSGDSNYSIGRIRKVAKSYLIDGSSYSLADMPSSVKFNGKSLSFKLAPSTPTGFKIVLPPALSGSIQVNGVNSDLTAPDATVQINFNSDPDQTSYMLAIGHTIVSLSVDGLYSLTVGEANKTSSVTLFGCTFADDGLAARSIVGEADIKVIVPVPATAFESNIAEVYVDGKRVAYFTRQPYTDELNVKQFNPAYFARPYLDSDIDASKGILRIVQSQTAAGLPTFMRIDTLAKLAAMPNPIMSCYYDYYTNKMYWFNVLSPHDLTSASSVYVEDFSEDPLACYQQIDKSASLGSPNSVAYFVLLHKSGKVRFQHRMSNWPAGTRTRVLPHDIVSGCATHLSFDTNMSLGDSARLLVCDSKGTVYKYKIYNGVVLIGKVTGKPIVKLASSSYSLASPRVLALSGEARTNVYEVDALPANPPTLTRQPINSATKNMQAVDLNSNYFLALVYDFLSGRIRVVDLSGADAIAAYAKNFSLLSGTGGKFVSAHGPSVAADAYLRWWDRNLPHVSTALAYTNSATWLDFNSDYDGTTITSGCYNYGADSTVEAIVVNATGDTVVESIVYDLTGSNEIKKKGMYVDVYQWNGTAFVLFASLTTSTPVAGVYTEVLTLPTPMPLHSSGKIKLGVRGTRDTYGYRWVTELRVMLRRA